MSLLLGTRDGVWLAPDPPFGGPEQVCDAGKVYGLSGDGDGGWLAAAADGLYRGSPNGTEWERSVVPETPVTAAAATPDGERLFAGTRPARLFVSEDGGETWTAADGFESLPSRGKWWNPDVTPHVRALATHPEAPDRVVAGVDGGGVHLSDDRGEAWSERCTAVSGFIHDLCLLGPEEWVAASDAGVFRTRDAGEWWDYLYDDDTYHRYFRGVFADGTTVYTGGARSHPPVWRRDGSADAGLYRLGIEERAPKVSLEPYPGEPEDVVLAGTVADVGPVAGTHEGKVLLREGGEWGRAGEVPGGAQIRSMVSF
jgi:hypothetical protein